MENKIIKINKEINKIENFNSITLIGDPGCDGLGAGTMSIFAKALTGYHSDFTIIAGDIVHKGIKNLYDSVTKFVNNVSPVDVYMLCGNHDTAYYEEYFGLRNYALVNDNTLLIFLDDSKRAFEPHTLQFLQKTLEENKRENIVLLFHIPPPNSVGSNTINNEEWQKALSLISPYKDFIKYIICGHVHSFYEDQIDNMKLIVTGGGGARIEYVNEKIDPIKAHHHIIRLYYKEDKLLYEHIPLAGIKYDREINDNNLRTFLEKSLRNESLAHIKYRLFADDAEEKGLKNLAKMFRAFAESEFYHAKNNFYVLNKMQSPDKNLERASEDEGYEIDVIYKEYLQYCRDNNFGLSEYTFYDSIESEKVHQKIVNDAIEKFGSLLIYGK